MSMSEVKMIKIEKRKIYGSIIGILSFVLLVVGVTYAYFRWSSTTANNTNVNLTVSKSLESSIVYNQGTSILETAGATLEPGFDYTEGINTTIEFWKKETSTKTIYGQISLEVLNLLSATDTLDTNIAKTDTLKWTITTYNVNDSTETVINTGSFYNKSIGDKWSIAQDFELNNYQTFYKIYLWIDLSAVDDTKSISGELISTEISAAASDIRSAYYEPIIASNAIIDLADAGACSANGSGVCMVEHTNDAGTVISTDYIYRGAEVDNYVWFNNDMYRIIGVYDDVTHGVEGEYLVKLIMANPLSVNSWGAYTTIANQNNGTYANYTSDWIGNRGTLDTSDDTSPANLNVLLNEYYFNKTNTSNTYGSCSNWTYYYDNTDYRRNDCSDIVGYGISSEVSDYIQSATWHLMGYIYNSYSKQNFYLCERGQSTDTTNCMSGNSGTYDASTEDEIGLMYVSDYMYASGYFASDDTTTGSSDYYGNQNWLYKGHEWTITPGSSEKGYQYVFVVGNAGVVNVASASHGSGARPSFYLKSKVLIDGGEGTINNPFTLSM